MVKKHALAKFKLYYEELLPQTKYGLSKWFIRTGGVLGNHSIRRYRSVVGFILQSGKNISNYFVLCNGGVMRLSKTIRNKPIAFFGYLCIMKTVIVKRLQSLTKSLRRKNKMQSNNNTDETVNKTTKKGAKSKTNSYMRGILGILMAFVIVSIAYSVVTIFQGTKGWGPKIWIAPEAIFAFLTIGYAFWKSFNK